MIKVVSNVNKVTLQLSAKLKQWQDPNGVIHDKMIRAIATTAAGLVRQRVHVEGKKSDGSDIGTYTERYLQLRQDKYNRTSDDKVVFSLTRQMENDLALNITNPIKTEKGYGIGFKNPANVAKALNLQNGAMPHTVKPYTRKGRNDKTVQVKSHNRRGWKGFGQVYNLTAEEKKTLLKAAQDYINTL